MRAFILLLRFCCYFFVFFTKTLFKRGKKWYNPRYKYKSTQASLPKGRGAKRKRFAV